MVLNGAPAECILPCCASVVIDRRVRPSLAGASEEMLHSWVVSVWYSFIHVFSFVRAFKHSSVDFSANYCRLCS